MSEFEDKTLEAVSAICRVIATLHYQGLVLDSDADRIALAIDGLSAWNERKERRLARAKQKIIAPPPSYFGIDAEIGSLTEEQKNLYVEKICSWLAERPRETIPEEDFVEEPVLDTCKICGENFALGPAFHHENGVCDECARKVGNSWWRSLRHDDHLDFCSESEREKILWFRNIQEPRRKDVVPYRLRIEVFERDEYRCQHCGSHKRLRVDHVIPESKGGPTVIENLQTLCHPCNTKKGAKMPEEVNA